MTEANVLATDILIDHEFSTLCPALSDDEYRTLEASILAEGCRDALVVWTREPEDLERAGFGYCKGGDCRYADTQVPGGEWVLEDGRWTCPECGWGIAPYDPVLLDGHNRKAICDEHGLGYDVTFMTLPDRDAARLWVWRNQLGRRNLNPTAAGLMRGNIYNAEKKREGGSGANQYTVQLDHCDPVPTADRLASEFGVSAPTIKRDGQFAAAVDALTPLMPDLRGQVMAGDAPTRKEIIEAAETAKTDPERATHQLISQSKSNEWYTPPEYIEAARRVMGEIDLDPASNDIAQEWIRARTYYTEETDGLAHEWNGRLWMNPPWGRLTSDFVVRLASEIDGGRVTEAIALVNAHATDTNWFAPLWDGTLCFTDHRINYHSGGEEGSGSTHGSVFVYFGPHRPAFIREFAKWGAIVARVADEY